MANVYAQRKKNPPKNEANLGQNCRNSAIRAMQNLQNAHCSTGGNVFAPWGSGQCLQVGLASEGRMRERLSLNLHVPPHNFVFCDVNFVIYGSQLRAFVTGRPNLVFVAALSFKMCQQTGCP